MRRTFLIWLSAVICATFVVTGVLAYSQFSRTAQERAEQMMSTRLNDVLDLLVHADSSITYLNRANDASALDRARALADIIALNPQILQQQEELQGLCNRLGAERISVSNAEGVVEAAVPAELVGASLREDEEAQLPEEAVSPAHLEQLALVDPGKSEHRGSMQIAGVRRRDKEGIVRLGFRTRFEEASRKESSLDSPAMKLRLGAQGRVMVFRRGTRLSHDGVNVSQAELMALPLNEVRELRVDDEEYFAYVVEGAGYRLVGLLPAIEIYSSSLKGAQTILLSNLLLFAIMFVVVSYLLQRLVVRGMRRVNEALRDITEGNLERRVDVVDSPEFTRLSNGINFMVDSLRSVGEERQQSLRRSMELARTLQSAMLPNKFPNKERFALYAASFPAEDVGGDFYDYSMPDATHLHFLVADVDAGGIPAALYMMRALTSIRAISKTGSAPAQIITEVNRELCADNQSGIRTALFYGSLDVETGELTYVNAGRLSAVLQHDGAAYTAIPCENDPPLGEDAQAVFREMSLRLSPADRLFMYSGGLLAVSNTQHELFTEKRLRAALAAEAEDVTEVVHQVRSALREFAEGPKPKKDIAMLSLEYKGEEGSSVTLSFRAQEAQAALELITDRMEQVFAAPPDIDAVQASARMALAALPAGAEVRMHFRCTEHAAELQLCYPAPAQNPLEKLPQPLPLDRATYEWTQENRLTLCKTLM